MRDKGEFQSTKNYEKKLKIIVFLVAFKEKPLRSLLLLSRQSLIPHKVVIVAAYETACVRGNFRGLDVECLVVRPDMSLTVGERVGIALTLAFNKFNITNADHLLKLDSDLVFTSNFIKENIESNYDLLGGGSALFVRIPKYLSIFDKRWPIVTADDAYIIEAFKARGFKILEWDWICKPYVLTPSHFTIRRMLRVGLDMYRFGIPFINMLYRALKLCMRNFKSFHLAIAVIVGYMLGSLNKVQKLKHAKEIKEYYQRKQCKIVRMVC